MEREIESYISETLSFMNVKGSYIHEMLAYTDEIASYTSEMVSYMNEKASYNRKMLAYTDEIASYTSEIPSYMNEKASYNREMVSCRELKNTKWMILLPKQKPARITPNRF